MAQERRNDSCRPIGSEMTLKAAGFVESGVDPKFAVQDGLVKVNGQVETARGKKLVPGDVVEYDGQTLKIE